MSNLTRNRRASHCGAWLLILLATSLGCARGQELKSGDGRVSVNGVEIYYRTAGAGPPLLLVHGFTNAGQVWEPFIDELGREYSLIIPDLRGHGQSTNPGGAFTHRLAAQDLIGLLDALGVSSCKAVGHSSGAIAILEMALIEPDRVEAMVLVDGAHRFPEATRQLLTGVNADTLVQNLPWFFNRVLTWHPGGMNQLRALAAQVRTFGADPSEVDHTASELKAVNVRTLIVHGDRDDLYPVDLALELYRALPQSALWVMPQVGHEAVFMYQLAPPEAVCAGCRVAGAAFSRVVLDFLAER